MDSLLTICEVRQSFSTPGGQLPGLDNTVRLQFRDHIVLTVGPDQDPSDETGEKMVYSIIPERIGGRHTWWEMKKQSHGLAFLYHIWLHWSKFGTVQLVLSRVAYYRWKQKQNLVLSFCTECLIQAVCSFHCFLILDAWFCQDLCAKEPLLLWAKDRMSVTFLPRVSNKMRCTFYRWSVGRMY